VALKTLDSGRISVFGSSPGENRSLIGYMPQDTTSLLQIFTIQETFWFFGRIYGMEPEEINSRTKFLSEFLKLPDPSRLLYSLRLLLIIIIFSKYYLYYV
jgi:ABC-type multidrug transport system ATPase subunit